MTEHPRLYTSVLQDHLATNRQMAFFSGPRQVGKTTACQAASDHYLNWDNVDDRRLILKGPGAMAERLGVDRLRATTQVATFDELHKYPKWKGLLKGFFDTYGKRLKIIVTGSSRMDVFRRGGDSLMGRYFLYRMHPFSVGECLRTGLPAAPVVPPQALAGAEWDALWQHGGFPEPFLRRDARFTRRWQALRHAQLCREDVRDMAQIHDLRTLETLVTVLAERSGQQLIYSNLATEIQVSVDTVKRWVSLLERLHYGFLLRPWFTNVTKALRKEPKWFLRDWSGIDNEGAKAETFIANHLLKAVDGWTDLGLGKYELHYLRDRQQREVDFLIVQNRKPWVLVEAKMSATSLSPALAHFQAQTKAPHALQVVLTLPYENVDCLSVKHPVVVPAKTFLSQLL